jgi:hypothetical protein
MPDLPGAVCVVIENHASSRPQSGLDKADTVYEMDAEGGITRFLAIFFWETSDKIGPVRSIRPYITAIAKAYASPLVHAGGSEDGLLSISKLKVQNLDEIYNASAYFWRDPNRRMPHNLYTSIERILAGSQKKKYLLTPVISYPLGRNPEGQYCEQVTVTYNSGRLRIEYRYVDGRYQRYLNESPFLSDNNKIIETDNIVVIVTRITREVKNNETYAVINTTGSGVAYFFTNGEFFEGQWERKSETDHFHYTINGEPARFAKGKTWVQIVGSSQSVTYDLPEDTANTED